MCHFVGVCLCVSPSLLKSEMCMMQLHRGKVRSASAAVQPDGRCEDFRQTGKERKGNSTLIMSLLSFIFTLSSFFFFLFLGILTNYARLVFSFHFVLLLPFSFQLPSHFTTRINCAGIKNDKYQ